MRRSLRLCTSVTCLAAVLAAVLAAISVWSGVAAAELATAASAAQVGKPASKAPKKLQMTMAIFLDRLMIAESGGRDEARNSRSTAVGPFQFIESTFMDVARRHFPKDIEKLDDGKLLALRTDRAFARKVAEAYTKDNAAELAAAGLTPTFPNLRLAFLLGAGGATAVLKARGQVRLLVLLGPKVIRANPFMMRLTAGGLIARAARDIAADPGMTAGIVPGTVPVRLGRTSRPRIKVRCNLSLPSCRRWLSLKKRSLRAKKRRQARVSRK